LHVAIDRNQPCNTVYLVLKEGLDYRS